MFFIALCRLCVCTSLIINCNNRIPAYTETIPTLPKEYMNTVVYVDFTNNAPLTWDIMTSWITASFNPKLERQTVTIDMRQNIDMRGYSSPTTPEYVVIYSDPTTTTTTTTTTDDPPTTDADPLLLLLLLLLTTPLLLTQTPLLLLLLLTLYDGFNG